MKYNPQQIKEIYNKAPEQIRGVLASPEFGEAIEKIATSHKLEKEKQAALGRLVLYVLLEMEKKEDLSKRIKEDLAIDDNTATQITKEVGDKIVNNIDGFHEMILKNIQVENLANGITEDKTVDDIVEKEVPKKPEEPVKITVESKIKEIGKKYSLTEVQIDLLTQKVSSAMTTPSEKTGLLEKIILDLKISRLLTEQIMVDLETRVFVSTSKTTENKPASVKQNIFKEIKEEVGKTEGAIVNPPHVPKSGGNQDTGHANANVPEIKPDNLPMVEEGEVSHDSSKQLVANGEERGNTIVIKKLPPVPDNLPIETPKVEVKPEPVQRPVAVPRFTGASIEETEKKLGTTVSSDQQVNGEIPKKEEETSKQAVAGSEEETQPIIEKPPQKGYVDPYREPIE